MNTKDKLIALQSDEPSGWLERAEWRQKNRDWLLVSSRVAVKVLTHIRVNGIKKNELAEMLDVSPQYVGKILKGQENLTLETICKIEKALNIQIISV